MLVALMLAFAAAGCALGDRVIRGAGSSISASPTTVAPTDLPAAAVLVEAKLVGGFIMPGLRAIRAPRLVVYGDGRAVADASRVLTLAAGDVQALMTVLDRDVAGIPSTVRPRGGVAVMDAPTSVLTVRAADGAPRRVSAAGLAELAGAYPAELTQAWSRITVLAQRVITTGSDYRADRVRLVGALAAEPTGAVRVWPAGVSVPPSAAQDGSMVLDVTGPTAAAVVRQVPRDAAASGRWPLYRTPQGKVVALAWRYLLPHE